MEDPKKEKVLIVDDERTNIAVLTDLLKNEYRVMVVKSGEQALKAARLSDPPNIILLDIVMPDMDGYEVCEQLKADPETRDIPIIFISALGDAGDEEKGLALGAMDYITKPFSPSIVRSRVKTQLCLKQNIDNLKRANEIIETQKIRMESELNAGRLIQQSRLPTTIKKSEHSHLVDIFAYLLPAREIGGDFYDYYFIDDERLLLCVGDVSGKGVPSALFMAESKIVLKTMADQYNSTSRIVTGLNRVISENNERCMFVTLFLAIVNVRTGETQITNAGHNPPMIRRKTGDITPLRILHGPIVGIKENHEYSQDTIRLSPNDYLILYTDGITEARNPNGEFLEENRLIKTIGQTDYEDAERLVIEVVGTVHQFENGAERGDDLTILVFRLTDLPTTSLPNKHKDDSSD